ncbi:MAG: hypothetical protein AAF826_08940 [Pseudomonadota bacterium]
MVRKTCLAVVLVCLMGQTATAQSDDILAAVRAELATLQAELQDIRTTVSATPDGVAPEGAGSVTPVAVLERIDALEAELRSLTGRVERQGFEVSQRLTAAEARLVALADVLSDKDGQGPLEPIETEADNFLERNIQDTALTAQERLDFNRIEGLTAANDFEAAIRRADQFILTYPGGPLTLDVMLTKAQSYVALEQWNAAADAYFTLFTEAGEDDIGSRALMGLAASFEQLAKIEDACRSYAQVGEFYASSAAVIPADQALKRLECPS